MKNGTCEHLSIRVFFFFLVQKLGARTILMMSNIPKDYNDNFERNVLATKGFHKVNSQTNVV